MILIVVSSNNAWQNKSHYKQISHPIQFFQCASLVSSNMLQVTGRENISNRHYHKTDTQGV